MAFQVKIHQIRAFVEVARQGSIRGASRMLNMSQPALSKSIQELEEGLAAQLFFRRSKGVTLTDAGESFYQHASLILEELRAAQEEIRQRQGQLAGQINIGMGASISRSLMPAVISRFHQQHPQVKVRIMEGQLVSMINELRQGELDFTINTYYQGPYDQQLSELLDDQAQTPQVGVVCETFSACISLVAKSDFLSILPEEMGCDPLHGQGLVMLPVSEILPKAAYYLIQRRDSRQTPLTASLITQFRRECGYLQS
ncbi:LysR family transcriptional regulator [Escherichia coli]|nr:LysR family transcriptional regulator [Escherichia coli]